MRKHRSFPDRASGRIDRSQYSADFVPQVTDAGGHGNVARNGVVALGAEIV
jgi:hypothetical protein